MTRARVPRGTGISGDVRVVDARGRLVAMHDCLARYFPAVPPDRVILPFYEHWPVHAIGCPLRPGDSRFSTPPAIGHAC